MGIQQGFAGLISRCRVVSLSFYREGCVPGFPAVSGWDSCSGTPGFALCFENSLGIGTEVPRRLPEGCGSCIPQSGASAIPPLRSKPRSIPGLTGSDGTWKRRFLPSGSTAGSCQGRFGCSWMSPTSVSGTNNFHFSGRAMLVLLSLTMTRWDQR